MSINRLKTEGEDILPRLASGDSAAFKEYLLKYGKLIRSMTREYRHFHHHFQEENDVAEEILIKVIEKSTRFDGTKWSEVEFVSQVAKEYLQKSFRTCAECKNFEFAFDEDSAAIELARESSEKSYEIAEKINLVVRQLNDKERQIFEMLKQGDSAQEISNALGISLSSARQMKARVVAKARKLISELEESGANSKKNIENKETILRDRISSIFPAEKRKRYDDLYIKFQRDDISKREYEELVRLSEEFESLNAKRLKYISELAKERGTSVEETVKEFSNFILI